MKKTEFCRTARRQFRSCAIPTATAVATSVLLSKLNAPLILIGGLGACGYAYWRGYRIRIVKPQAREEDWEQ